MEAAPSADTGGPRRTDRLGARGRLGDLQRPGPRRQHRRPLLPRRPGRHRGGRGRSLARHQVDARRCHAAHRDRPLPPRLASAARSPDPGRRRRPSLPGPRLRPLRAARPPGRIELGRRAPGLPVASRGHRPARPPAGHPPRRRSRHSRARRADGGHRPGRPPHRIGPALRRHHLRPLGHHPARPGAGVVHRRRRVRQRLRHVPFRIRPGRVAADLVAVRLRRGRRPRRHPHSPGPRRDGGRDHPRPPRPGCAADRALLLAPLPLVPSRGRRGRCGRSRGAQRSVGDVDQGTVARRIARARPSPHRHRHRRAAAHDLAPTTPDEAQGPVELPLPLGRTQRRAGDGGHGPRAPDDDVDTDGEGAEHPPHPGPGPTPPGAGHRPPRCRRTARPGRVPRPVRRRGRPAGRRPDVAQPRRPQGRRAPPTGGAGDGRARRLVRRSVGPARDALLGRPRVDRPCPATRRRRASIPSDRRPQRR